jgi:Calcineurin-like phosphoesterase
MCTPLKSLISHINVLYFFGNKLFHYKNQSPGEKMRKLFQKKPLSLWITSCLVLAVPGMVSAADLASKAPVSNAVTAVGTKIAFVGDTDAGGGFQSVLNLIKAEGAKLTVVLGDTSYSSSRDNTWDSMVRNTLGSADPALFVVGNHDILDSNYSTVRNLAQARLNNQTAVKCSSSYPTSTGTSGAMACQLNNVYMVLSGVGTTGSRSSNESALSSKLNSAPAGAWRICAWHKNQRDMQVGGKTDEVGWTSYETCRKKGAIIATGHEHSYSRTHLLSSMSSKIVADSSSPYTLTNGRTIAFVSGLGGTTPRDQERSGNWWGKIYTATQSAKHGVLFGTFYDTYADFYFKNVNGQIIDSFTVHKGY